MADLSRLLRSVDGNIAIITALILPILCLFIALVFEVGMATSYIGQSKRIMALACERSTKPTRTMTPSDDVRRENVTKTFDALAKSAKQTVTARDATIDWLNTDLTASFEYKPVFAGLLGQTSYKYDLAYECVGIPPYPHDGEIVLSSALTKPDGTEFKLDKSVTLKSPTGCWGVFPATAFGWDSGTGAGVEVQDWSYEYCRDYYKWTGLPPADFPSPYAIELDSYNNSSMTKTIELHPGSYEFSVWYNGRNPKFENSNEIQIQLQKTRPTKLASETIISMKQDKDNIKWEKYTYKITVKEYSIYNLTILAAEKSDSVGGIITSFVVKYINR